MFKKVVSLCLSAAAAMSVGVVVGAEVPKEEYDFNQQDCRSVCAMKNNFEAFLDKKVEIIDLLIKSFGFDLRELSKVMKVLTDENKRKAVLEEILKEKSSGKSEHSKEDLKAAAGLASNENVGEFAAKRVIKPVNKVFTEAVLELQARVDKFNEVKNKLDEAVEEKCICPGDVTGL